MSASTAVTSAALFAAAALALRSYLAARAAGFASRPSIKNWSRNQTFSPSVVHAPTTLAALCALVRASPRVKALGSAHAFNAIADPSGHALVRLDALETNAPVLAAADAAAGGGPTVTLGAALTYGALVAFLRGTPFAVANLASLPHISIGGAVATSTHGSGARNGGLASAVRALEIVRADGRVDTLRASDADGGAALRGAVVHLGALGIVTRVTLALVPAFDLRQDVYEGVPFARALDDLDAVLGAAYSVSLFTTWAEPLVFAAWRKSTRAELPPGAAPAEWVGGALAAAPAHPIPGIDAAPCTPQGGVFGSALDRLCHFRLDFTPSVGDELQSEYAVARAAAPAALRALRDALRPELAAAVFVTEIRAVARDDDGLSLFAGRETVCIHFTWRPLHAVVAALLPRVEAALAPFRARPHWGKLFAADAAALAAAHGVERVEAFRARRRAADPTGKFMNAFLRDAGLE